MEINCENEGTNTVPDMQQEGDKTQYQHVNSEESRTQSNNCNIETRSTNKKEENSVKESIKIQLSEDKEKI